MVPPVCSIFVSQLAPRAERELAQTRWRDGRSNTLKRRGRAFGVCMGLVADRGR
jgi:hypothetical protein